ncbi:O-antigen ligase family protein [Curvivirga aplysinae]|uniref:O-antigen ligase family protein n=1 Tax=Curvivirga aplysinae TaxID=2529852 RepID=UPI0012BC5E75|nr:O-antigen ligase family protein [Curvivirga aplysinae]MTI09239.1 O-antigen ligase family protein [Curvivirga aplysinae]
MANFTGQPKQLDADRLDYWMAGLFGVGIALSPVSRVAMGIVLVPAIILLTFRFLRTTSFRMIWAYRRTAIGIGIVAIFSWFAITSVFSIDPGKSLQVTLRTLAMIIVAVMFYHYAKSRKGLAQHGMKIGLTVFVIWCLIGIYFIYFNIPLFKTVFYDWLGITNRLIFYKNDSALAFVFLAVALYFLLRSQAPNRWIYAACIVILILFIYADNYSPLRNRSAMAGNVLGLIGATFFIMLTFLSTIWRKIVVALLFALALFGTASVMERLAPIEKIGEVPAPALSYPDHHRQVIWSFVYEKLKANPLLGVGIDGIAKTEHANTKLVFFKGQEYVPAHPHNWVLEVAVETGVIGIILVLLVMAIFILNLQKLFRQKNIDRKMIFVIFYFFCSFWIISMAAFSIWSAWWLISFFMTLAMMMAVAKEKASA